MQAQTVRINLRYERAELKQILRYAKAHDVERNGRYDFRRLNARGWNGHQYSGLIARTTAGIGPAMTGATSRGAGVVPATPQTSAAIGGRAALCLDSGQRSDQEFVCGR